MLFGQRCFVVGCTSLLRGRTCRLPDRLRRPSCCYRSRNPSYLTQSSECCLSRVHKREVVRRQPLSPQVSPLLQRVQSPWPDDTLLCIPGKTVLHQLLGDAAVVFYVAVASCIVAPSCGCLANAVEEDPFDDGEGCFWDDGTD